MKAAVLTGPGKIEVRDRAKPEIKEKTEVLLRVKTVGLCGSDLHYFHEERVGDTVMTYPVVLGHECAAVVEQTGPGVTRVKPGDRVAVEPAVSCGVCDQCRAGRPNPLVDLRVVDDEMNDVPHDGKATGEIVLRAPWVTMGYLKDERSSAALWAGGYLHTGDIGFIDELGYLQVSDRIKDVIKTGGEWISSLDLENIIGQHPAVSEVAVIGVPDDKWGERPLALVVLRDGAPDDADDIRRFALDYAQKGVIPKFGVPDRILFVREIPKTSVGKLDKKVLREKYCG